MYANPSIDVIISRSPAGAVWANAQSRIFNRRSAIGSRRRGPPAALAGHAGEFHGVRRFHPIARYAAFSALGIHAGRRGHTRPILRNDAHGHAHTTTSAGLR